MLMLTPDAVRRRCFSEEVDTYFGMMGDVYVLKVGERRDGENDVPKSNSRRLRAAAVADA